MSDDVETVEIPESEAPGLTQIHPAMQALMLKLGLSEADVLGVVKADGEPFMKHADFDRQRGADGEQRCEYPTNCEGTLRIENDERQIWDLRCDVCGANESILAETVAPARAAERRLSRAGIPPMFAGKTFEPNGDAEPVLQACREWLKGFKREPLPAPGLWGLPGRGKSHLLSLMVETLVTKMHVDAMYRTAAALFDEMRKGIDEGSYEARWHQALSVRVLALDDLAASRMTDWQRERFATLVDHRFTHGLPLLFATNLPPNVWDEAFGARTSSRLRGMALPFRLEGHDWRAQGVQQTLTEQVA